MTQISYEYGLPPSSAHAGSAENETNPNQHNHKRGARKPLEKSKLSVVGKSLHAKKHSLQFPADNTEFYTNIWTAPPTTAGRNKESVQKFIDISQVSYVVTTIDFKDGYESTSDFELVNIWTMEAYSVTSTNSMSVEAGHSARYLSNLANISEADEDDARTTHLSSSAPILDSAEEEEAAGYSYRARSRLRKGISEEDLEMVASVPVSGPLRRGDSIVFSPVLAENNDVDRSWHARFLLGIHEPVRHALFVIDCFLERIQRRGSPTEWNVSEFFQWFKTHFVEFVKNQHDVKTKVLLPLVQVDYNIKRDIHLCYERIFEVLDAIAAQEDHIVFSAASESTSWQDRLFVLQSDIRKLNLLINSILTAEEKVLSPLLGRIFSEQNFQRYVMPRIFRATKPKRVVIPWIVERCRIWGGDKLAQAYKDELPFTARFLYDRMWLPYFWDFGSEFFSLCDLPPSAEWTEERIEELQLASRVLDLLLLELDLSGGFQHQLALVCADLLLLLHLQPLDFHAERVENVFVGKFGLQIALGDTENSATVTANRVLAKQIDPVALGAVEWLEFPNLLPIHHDFGEMKLVTESLRFHVLACPHRKNVELLLHMVDCHDSTELRVYKLELTQRQQRPQPDLLIMHSTNSDPTENISKLYIKDANLPESRVCSTATTAVAAAVRTICIVGLDRPLMIHSVLTLVSSDARSKSSTRGTASAPECLLEGWVKRSKCSPSLASAAVPAFATTTKELLASNELKVLAQGCMLRSCDVIVNIERNSITLSKQLRISRSSKFPKKKSCDSWKVRMKSDAVEMNTVVATTATPPPQSSAPDAQAAPAPAPAAPAAAQAAAAAASAPPQAPPAGSVVVVKETIGKDGQPVREWIDTLLMAAVIAKDKQQQQPGVDECAEPATEQPGDPTAAATELVPSAEDAAAMAENMSSNGSDTQNRPIANAIATTTPEDTKKDTTKEEQEHHQGDTTPEENSNDSTISTQNEGNRHNEEEDVDDQQVEEARNGEGESEAKRYRRRRCEVSGCTKFARFNNACSGHGGRRLCSHAGCTRVAQFGHKCSAHGGIKYCSVEGCSRAVQSRGCCKTHGGGVRCQTSGCEKGAISKGHCRSHGGGSRCAESGCQKWAQRHGFCVRHSKAEAEGGGGAGEDAGA